jgi:hypothetical protein
MCKEKANPKLFGSLVVIRPKNHYRAPLIHPKIIGIEKGGRKLWESPLQRRN